MTGESIPGNYYLGNNVTGKQNLLMTSLTNFFNKNNIDSILSILDGKSKISLRIIDWFVTNYAKKNNIIYYIPSDSLDGKKKSAKKNIKVYSDVSKYNYNQFIVYLNYKSQLKAYSKKQFDPFCRRDRIHFYYNKENPIVTTVGQLNFFRWALENRVIDYIYNNLKLIEDDMNLNIRNSYPKYKTKKKSNSSIASIIDTKRKKRKELSVSATKSLNKHKVNIVLDFN
jgi:hypothetical protein